MKQIDVSTPDDVADMIKILQEHHELFLYNSKDWRERFEPLRKYINENYYNLHPNKIPLERLEQLYRNLERWRNQFTEQNEVETGKWIEDTLISINRRIQFLKGNPTDPDEKYILKILPEINKNIFINSTLEQWKDLIKGNYIDLEITANNTARLMLIIAVIDEILKRCNGHRNLEAFAKNEIFKYQGKFLTAKQLSDNGGKIPPHKLPSYLL